jgi:drug/metabolite transporter (DMT)-like permease
MSVSAKAWVPAFLTTSLFWGSSFLFIHVALESFTPAEVAFGRVVVGAVVLAGMLLFMRHRPRFSWRELWSVALVALALSVVPFILIPLAELHITSILASLLNATTPLWTALFVALLIPTEKATRLQVVGLVIGALGIAVLLGAWNVSELPIVGAALMLAATAFYGLGGTFSRVLLRSIRETPTGLSAAQMVLSSLMLAPIALISSPGVVGSGEHLPIHANAVWALIALGLFGTSFAYVLFYRVVRVVGATTAASTTYVVPIVAAILGVVVLHEELHWYEPVGAAVVLGGVWLATRKPKVDAEPAVVAEAVADAEAAGAAELTEPTEPAKPAQP